MKTLLFRSVVLLPLAFALLVRAADVPVPLPDQQWVEINGELVDLRAPVPFQYPYEERPFQFAVQTWISSGKSSWEISFLEILPVFGLTDGRSRLEWESLESIVVNLHASYQVSAWLRMEAAYGFGDIDDGENTDTDWFGPGGGDDFLLFQSIAETDGSLNMFRIGTAVQLHEVLNLNLFRGQWDLIFGYRFHKESLRDRKGIETVDFGRPVYAPFDDLDSTFDFEWSGFHLGLAAAVPLTARFSVTGEAVGLLGMKYKGAGFWNLRDDFRDQSPNFTQRASNGWGTEIKAGLQFAFTDAFYAELGYWYCYVRAENGSDKIYFSDGSVGGTQLDWAETERQGMYLGVGGRF